MVTIYAGKVVRRKSGPVVIIASAQVPETVIRPLPAKVVHNGKD